MADESTNQPHAQNDAWGLMGTASREKADAYLEEQTRLARLQVLDLEREDRVRHWSLLVHHTSDLLKLSLELAAAIIFVSIVVAIAAAIWMASHDDGLVIDAFQVPPDMAAKGLTGDVVASQLLDRLTQMQAETDSSRAPDTYASDWASGIKVYIPNTGISVGDAYRYLAAWLGHQTHISGEVYHTANGIVVTTRVGGDPGVSFAGREADISKLMQRAAESVYHLTQPYRYAIYVGGSIPPPLGTQMQGRLLGDLALNGPESEKPWAYTVWSYAALFSDNVPEALRRAQMAVSYAPDLPLTLGNLAGFEQFAGHSEQAVAAARLALKSLDGPGAAKVIPRANAEYRPQFAAFLAEEAGDWNAAAAQYEVLRKSADFEGLHWNSQYATATDLAFAHDLRGSRAAAVGSDAQLENRGAAGYGWQLPNLYWPGFTRAAALGDWPAARRDMLAVLDTGTAKSHFQLAFNRMQIWPWLALADAHVGDGRAAWSLIGKTPIDCYDCLRVRGLIDTTQRNWNGAGYWFARAAKQAPSIPFAYSDWGQMLMAKGDRDGAIAKFAIANQKGPHFADPPEMWGEALIAKNRSDLALAKFEEADKYAPRWGRLHLKWAEALLWSGDRTGAQKQFAIASGLDLSEGEKSELKRMAGAHV